ncbi:MAG TPA: hypothetical protein PKW21_05170 [Rhabdaerophilum sp.]|nr:hypothetical protein [Rhabdaerophilum sp.]
MRANSSGTGLLRIILIPLACALFALSGIAASRAGAARLADPDGLAKVALCLPSGLPTDRSPHDHDCDACCLVVPVALVPPQPVPVAVPAIECAVLLREGTVPRVAGNHLLPWSRGPPATA